MASYKRDFSKKVKRNIRKNIKTRKYYNKRRSYKNKRYGNKTKKGGWGFSLSSNSSDSGNTTNSSNSNTDYENNIRTNMKEPFILKDDMVILEKRIIKNTKDDPDRKKRYNKYADMNEYDCNKLSSSSKKECLIFQTQLYKYKFTEAYAYDRGEDENNNYLKVYLPEDKVYKLYPYNVTATAFDFKIYPVKYVTGPDGKKSIEYLIRSDQEKRKILEKNINANLMSIQKV
jgi:hypothetical protein